LGLVFSGAFWLAILGALAYWLFAPHNRAKVILQTSPQPPRQFKGIVLFKGAPVSEGIVHLVFEDPRKNRYLASTILSITQDGKFGTLESELVFKDSNEEGQPLRVTAAFSGRHREKKDAAPIPLKGTATRYLHYPAAAG
jgi:hypothetical protein